MHKGNPSLFFLQVQDTVITMGKKRGSCVPQESGEEGERSGSNHGASPSAVKVCKLSKAACR